jgi:hypothetical protein
MITIGMPTYSVADLPNPTVNNSQEMFDSLAVAVKANAQLCEPLNNLLPQTERNETTLLLMRSVRWLENNAPLDMGAPFPLASYSRWLANIGKLTDELIAANYDQGREGGSEIFDLTYPPTRKTVSGYQLMPIQPVHWALFVQAAMATHYIEISTENEMAKRGFDVFATEWAKALVAGTTARLALAYPRLRMAERPGFAALEPISVCAQEANAMWTENIDAAASLFDASLTAA